MSDSPQCPFSGATKPELRGYRTARQAAKNYRAYSSDLLGDEDIRSYRHLPLEADPPRHTQLRAALMPLFAAEAIEVRGPEFRALARRLISEASARDHADLMTDVALPYVLGCIGIIYNRTQDVQEWIDWGPNVWLAGIHATGEPATDETKRAQRERNYTLATQRSAKTVDDYLDRVLEEAQNPTGEPREPTDVWQFLVDSRPGGDPLTHEELVGTGSVLLAGGRDTGIKLITGLLWHLVRAPEDREYLTDHPHARPAAINEMARYFTPLPRLERLDVAATAEAGHEQRVLLSFLSANFDRDQFPDPERLDIHRPDKPNLAFGFGRHSCLGLQVTMHETLALLEELLPHWPGWELAAEPHLEWITQDQDDYTVTVLDHIGSVPVATPAART